MMCELRKFFVLFAEFDIKIKTTYIRSAANIWADGLSRIKDNSDWKLKESKFRRLNKLWGPVSIDRFASFENKQNPGTTPSGETDGQNKSTLSTSRTTRGIESSTSATHHGRCWTASRQNSDRLELPRSSSHQSGPIAPCSHSSPS